MTTISVRKNLIVLLFFLHPLIYIVDGDIYRNYEVLGVFIVFIFAFKNLNSINFKSEKRYLLFFYIYIFIQQFFIENRDFPFGMRFFIMFVVASVPFWLFENYKFNTEDFSKIIDLSINIIFYFCFINYISSYLFNFGEVYTSGGILLDKRAFGILGDSFTPILNFLQIYFISKKQYKKFLFSFFFLIITGGKAGIFMSLFILITDFFIKKKSYFKRKFFIISLFISLIIALFIGPRFQINEFISNVEYSYNNRILSFELGLNYFKDSPLIGIGINKGLERADFDSEALADFYGIDNYARVWQVQNSFLRLLSETGIIGISLILIVNIIWFKKLFFCLRETKYERTNLDNLTYSTSLWIFAFIVTYQGIAWFVPGHPLFAWTLMFTTINNIFIKKNSKF